MKIAIVGAGMSAAGALHFLRQYPCEVTLFEKSRGPGGRMSSKRALAGSLDLGAQYFTTRDKVFGQQVAKWQNQGLVLPWTVTPWLSQHGVLSRSDDQTQRYIGATTMHQMLSADFAGLDVHYQCKIDELSFIDSNVSSHATGQWQLCSAQGECYGGFDALLLTCPPQQSRLLLEQAVLPTTQLSNKLATTIIPQLTAPLLLPCWAVLLELSTPSGVAAEAIFVKDGPACWIAKQSAKPGRHSARLTDTPLPPEQWLVHFSAEYSQLQLENSADQLTELATIELARVLGRSVEVAAALCHRWLYASYNTDLPPPGVLFDRQLSLAVAGDWTLGGRVENAWLSGIKAAEALLQNKLTR